MMSTVIGAIKLFGIGKSLIGFALVLAVLGGTYAVWYAHVFNKGQTYAINKIAANDARLVARAKKARGILQECQNSGRTWNQSTGECQ
jgi:hypothetical protein